MPYSSIYYVCNTFFNIFQNFTSECLFLFKHKQADLWLLNLLVLRYSVSRKCTSKLWSLLPTQKKYLTIWYSISCLPKESPTILMAKISPEMDKPLGWNEEKQSKKRTECREMHTSFQLHKTLQVVFYDY